MSETLVTELLRFCKTRCGIDPGGVAGVDPSSRSVVKFMSRVMDGPAGLHNPLGPSAPLGTFRTQKQLTAPADLPVRNPAYAFATSVAIAIGAAGSVHRRTGMRSTRSLSGQRSLILKEPHPRAA